MTIIEALKEDNNLTLVNNARYMYWDNSDLNWHIEERPFGTDAIYDVLVSTNESEAVSELLKG